MPTYTKIDPYKTYNYALLTSSGISGVFNIMRYDRAFLVRPRDLELLQHVSKEPHVAILQKLDLLLCKYDWHGKNNASWTYQILSSGQKLNEIKNANALLDIGSHHTNFHTSKPLKIRSEETITAALDVILQIMFDNHAVPATEADSSIIEAAFSSPDEIITVTLVNFLAAETKWNIPIGQTVH